MSIILRDTVKGPIRLPSGTRPVWEYWQQPDDLWEDYPQVLYRLYQVPNGKYVLHRHVEEQFLVDSYYVEGPFDSLLAVACRLDVLCVKAAGSLRWHFAQEFAQDIDGEEGA